MCRPCTYGTMDAPPVAFDAEVIEKRLEARRCSRFALGILLLAGFGWVSDGAEGIVLSYMLPTLEDTWKLTHAQMGLMSTVVSFGQAMGAAFWGALADVHGRRPIFLLSLGLTSLSGAASCAATGFVSYCALRLLTGFAIGGNLPLAVSVTSELLPPSHRERGIVALQLFNEVGSLASTRLAAALLPVNWRLYLLLLALPSTVVFVAALLFLPESPIWLLQRGSPAEAAQVLERIEAGGSGVLRVCPFGRMRHAPLAASDAQSAEVERQGREDSSSDGSQNSASAMVDTLSSSVPEPHHAQTRRRSFVSSTRVLSSAGSMRGLCAPPLAYTTLALCILWSSANFASGWWTWLPEFAKLQHLPAEAMYTSVTVARIVAMLAFVLAAAVIEPIGAYRLLLLALSGTTALSFVLTTVVDDPSLLASDLFVAVYSSFALCFGVVWPVMYVITPTSFPADQRAAGFGFVSACSKLGGLAQPNVVALLLPPETAAPPAPPHLVAPARAGLPDKQPQRPHHSSLYLIGLLFTAAWALALTATLVQAWRVGRASRGVSGGPTGSTVKRNAGPDADGQPVPQAGSQGPTLAPMANETPPVVLSSS